MSENAFAAAHKSLYDAHLKHIGRKENYEMKLESAVNRAWELQMKCFSQGKSECIHEFDQLFLEQHRFSRNSVLKSRTCINECEKLGTGYEPGNNVFDNETLNKSRKFYSCISPCIENMIADLTTENNIVDRNIQALNKYLKG